jgi:3-dehydroquinate synthase
MAKNDIVSRITVGLDERSYPIHIGRSILGHESLLLSHVKSNQVMIVSNTTVAKLYLDDLKEMFQNFQCDEVILDDGEQYKNQQSYFKIIDTLCIKNHHRDTTLIALGGGVVGDIAGFAASSYQRGVNFIQIPTTLLAQVDASVGGKTAINYKHAKNMIGSFYQPKAVIVDVNVLASLTEREFNSGLAEVVKYGMLADYSFFEWLESRIPHFNKSSTSHLIQAVSYCCNIKAKIVQQDERECGLRATLNLGHTFGHALESYSNYQQWLHGEAVAIGLYCAAIMSEQLGKIGQADVLRVKYVLEQSNLPTTIPADVNIETLYELMKHDKKISDDKINFVILKSLGEAIVTNNVPQDVVMSTLRKAQELA